jgi:catechol 2,3-dioxygenase-like lactoylglutathione lyase family enzyme
MTCLLRHEAVAHDFARPQVAERLLDGLLEGRRRSWNHGAMLLDGINHVAVLTNDTDRLHAFYREVFDADVSHDEAPEPGVRVSFIDVGPHTELNVFQVDGNAEPEHQTPMFGRGRLDHIGLHAESLDAFDTIRERLMARGATDGFVTDFGPILSLFFVDPDGLEGEVCVVNPDRQPGIVNPPGTPAARYAT